MYVDNLGILSVKVCPTRGLEQVEDIFEAHHLILHPGIFPRLGLRPERRPDGVEGGAGEVSAAAGHHRPVEQEEGIGSSP